MMKIETERLLLREMNEDDYDAFCSILADSDIMQSALEGIAAAWYNISCRTDGGTIVKMKQEVFPGKSAGHSTTGR